MPRSSQNPPAASPSAVTIETVNETPLQARELLDGFRDLGVPVKPVASPPLACDPSFNRYSAYWLLGPTLDSTFPALDAMALAPGTAREASLNEAERGQVLRFLGDHFHRGDQRFSTNASPRTRGVFAVLSAINVMKSLSGLRGYDPLTERRFLAVMTGACGDEAAGEALAGIDDLIASCRSDDGEGLIDNPKKPLIPSLTALSTAASVLWNLWPKQPRRGLARYFPAATLERFVDGCIQRGEEQGAPIAGFSIHPDIDQRCVNTTFFGLRLMKRLDLPLEPADRQGIERFLTCAYTEGGFSSTIGEPRSLNATFFGLKALEILDSPIARSLREEERHQVETFVLACRRPSGGFAFSRDPARYCENSLATRYAVQILTLIGAEVPPETWGFFRDRFDEEQGGFAAYPSGAVDTSGFDRTALERYLGRKDRRLLDAFPRQSAGSAGREWRRIQSLYDRLGELEDDAGDESAERSGEVATLWAELRELQGERARRYEEHFDETVLRPLEESRRAREAARQSLFG